MLTLKNKNMNILQSLDSIIIRTYEQNLYIKTIFMNNTTALKIANILFDDYMTQFKSSDYDPERYTRDTITQYKGHFIKINNDLCDDQFIITAEERSMV